MELVEAASNPLAAQLAERICTCSDGFVKRLGQRSSGDADRMSKKEKQDQELTQEELEEQNGEELPDREVMSLITPPTGADGIATIAPDEPPASG
jgi:hypothetical protein